MKDTLQELKEFRRAGIRTFADAEVYEADKKRRSTVQPSLSTALPGSLPRNWQYGMASADSNLQVFTTQFVAASIASLENFPSTLGLLCLRHWAFSGDIMVITPSKHCASRNRVLARCLHGTP